MLEAYSRVRYLVFSIKRCRLRYFPTDLVRTVFFDSIFVFFFLYLLIFGVSWLRFTDIYIIRSHIITLLVLIGYLSLFLVHPIHVFNFLKQPGHLWLELLVKGDVTAICGVYFVLDAIEHLHYQVVVISRRPIFKNDILKCKETVLNCTDIINLLYNCFKLSIYLELICHRVFA